jgi:hypothetical protein
VTIDRHRCDDSCLCPIHGTPMLYAASTWLHACQDSDCVHAHGVDLVALRYADLRRAYADLREARPELWYTALPPVE